MRRVECETVLGFAGERDREVKADVQDETNVR
jgi:hypothetical protein